MLLQSDESHHVVRLVEDDKSSLLWLRDKDSCHTVQTLENENPNLSKMNFEFDREVFDSRAYRMASSSNMRQALSSARGEDIPLQASLLDDSVGVVDSRGSNEIEDDAQTLTGEPVNSWSSSDGARIFKKSSQNDSINSKDHVARHDSECSTGFPQDNVREAQGNMPGASVNMRKPLPKMSLLPDNLPLSRPLGSSRQASSTLPNKDAPRGPPIIKPRNSRPSYLGLKKDNMLNLFKSRFSLSSGSVQEPQTSQVHSAGTKKSYLATPEEVPQERQKYPPKILLFGLSGAGKSTIVQSMAMLSGGIYSHSQREAYKEHIRSNIIDDMHEILSAMTRLEISFESEDNQRLIETLMAHHTDDWYTEQVFNIAPVVEALRNDSGVRTCLQRSNELYLNDSCG